MLNNYITQHIEENRANNQAKYIKNIIYGGLDGIITTFSIIAAAYGASMNVKSILILGIANLFSDALSMGIGDYISGIFEIKYILSEKEKEEIEYRDNRDFEIQELIQLFKEEGLNEDDATNIVSTLASKDEYKDLFIKTMLDLELNLAVPDNDPKKEGIVTFTSFIIFGSIPIIFYLICYLADYQNLTSIFIISCFLTIITLGSLGYYQAIVTKQDKIKGTLFVLGNGLIATTTAFLIGYGLEKAFN